MSQSETLSKIAPYLVLIVTAAACAYFAFENPFPKTLAQVEIPLSLLNSSQMANVERANKCLNAVTIKPGSTFSFNGTVGPRTVQSGYQEANSFLQGDHSSSLGGGICVLSSGLYQLALKAGLKITSRSPHMYPVRTVSPGLDATVWYGQKDLSFQNNTNEILRLRSSITGNKLNLSLDAANFAKSLKPYRLLRHEQKWADDHLRVEVFRSPDNKNWQLVSHDVYILPARALQKPPSRHN
jgi:vancomycin resistance protein YoaR